MRFLANEEFDRGEKLQRGIPIIHLLLGRFALEGQGQPGDQGLNHGTVEIRLHVPDAVTDHAAGHLGLLETALHLVGELPASRHE